MEKGREFSNADLVVKISYRRYEDSYIIYPRGVERHRVKSGINGREAGEHDMVKSEVEVRELKKLLKHISDCYSL